jgi:TatD DNase family protein
MFLDSHAHLDGKQFAADRDAIIQRAYDAGVRALLAIGNGDGPDEMGCAIPFAARYPWIWASAGVHPHEARLLTSAHLEEMERLARHPRVVAIGEIGLDYHYDFSPRDVQQAVFRAQIRLARELQRPVVIHTREADEDTIAILRDEGQGEVRGVLHCFTGNDALADAGLALGFFVSLAGIITFPKAEPLRQTVRRVPLDRLLTETDSPFLAPVPYRGKRNEPAYIRQVAERIAAVRGLAIEDLIRASAANAAAHKITACKTRCLADRTSAEWIERLNAAGVPCGMINTIDKVFADPQVAHLGIVQDIDTGDARGNLKVVGQPVSLGRTPSRLAAAPPERGQHCEEVLREFGFTDAEIAELRQAKVI